MAFVLQQQQQQARTSRTGAGHGRTSSVAVVAGLRWPSRKTPQPAQSPSPRRLSAATLTATTTQQLADRSSGGLADLGLPGRAHHVALLVKDLERSLAFYAGVLGLAINADRPHSKLPYRGAWLRKGSEMVHLLELADAVGPTSASRERRVCVATDNLRALIKKLEAAGVPFTTRPGSKPAVVHCKDPDSNLVELTEE